MISLRQHAISLAAVFLALAVGVVLGSGVLSDTLLSGLRDQKKDLQGQIAQLTDEKNVLNEKLAAADDFNTQVSGRIVHDALAGKSVVLIRTPDANDDDLGAISRVLGQAGAVTTGTIGLTQEFVDANSAEKLRSVVNSPILPAGTQLNTTLVDQGSQAGDLLGIALIRELGPVLAAILIAGRSGSAITAQIGVMRVTEELDAMKVMGIPKGFRLVLPRVMAMVVAMPLLAVWTTLAALLGGMLASDLVMGLTPAYFVTALAKAVQVSNLWLAVGKSAVFGLMIALIGCHYGLRIKPNTQSLGEGTTASVVTSITMVILVDAMFAVVFKNVGI